LEALEDRRLLAVLTVDVGGRYSTIQSAVDAASPGDIVEVRDGRYVESVDLSRMGSARGGATGDLVIRGGTASAAVVASPGGPAFFNSLAFSGDLVLQRLTLTSQTADVETSGLQIQTLSGDVAVTDVVFEQLAGAAVDLSGISGDVSVVGGEFRETGDDDADRAVRIAELDGYAALIDNEFAEVRGTAIVLENSGTQDASFLISGNRIRGDGVFFQTTHTGLDVRFAGGTQTDLTIAGNTLKGLAARGIACAIQDQARVQTRWSDNELENIRGGSALGLDLSGAAEAAVAVLANSVLDAWEDGLVIGVHDSSSLQALIRENYFVNVGDGENDDGLTVTTGAASAGRVDLVIDGNDFATVTGIGVHLSAGGANLTAAVENNVLNDVSSLSGEAAVLIEHAAVGASGAVGLRLQGNTSDAAPDKDAYLLRQRGSGDFLLEGTLGDAAAAVAATNVGQPVGVAGTVQVVPPGTLGAIVGPLAGGRAWHDLDGGGIQDQGEVGMARVRVSLSGLQSGTGAAVERNTHTDVDGVFAFLGLPEGQYTLTVHVPQGYLLTEPDQGADESLDSDFALATRTSLVAVTEGAGDSFRDAGLLSTWQNPREPLDVDDDGFVLPLDVLLIINELNRRGPSSLPVPPQPPNQPPPYLDVNGDGKLEPLDVLRVINHLNQSANSAGAGGEGESTAPAPVPSCVADPAPQSASAAAHTKPQRGRRDAPLPDGELPQKRDGALLSWLDEP